MTEVQIDAALLETFTIDDIDTLEEMTGVPIDQLVGKDAVPCPKGKLMRALGFVMKRHDDPSVTVEDIGRMTMAQLSALIGGVTAVPPANAAG